MIIHDSIFSFTTANLKCTICKQKIHINFLSIFLIHLFECYNFQVFDGFNGTEAASYVAHNLHLNIATSEWFAKDNFQKALHDAIMKTDVDFHLKFSEQPVRFSTTSQNE